VLRGGQVAGIGDVGISEQRERGVLSHGLPRGVPLCRE
jgi:hypothetical protein